MMWLPGWLMLISTGHAPLSSLPPSTFPCCFPFFPVLLPKSQPVLWLSAPPTSANIWLLYQVCLGQVLPALESAQSGLYNTESMRDQGLCLWFLSEVDQPGLLNSLIKINRIFATYNLQHQTRSWKEPEQQLDMKANWYLLINFTD